MTVAGHGRPGKTMGVASRLRRLVDQEAPRLRIFVMICHLSSDLLMLNFPGNLQSVERWAVGATIGVQR